MKHAVSKKILDTNTPNATQNEHVFKFRHEYLHNWNKIITTITTKCKPTNQPTDQLINQFQTSHHLSDQSPLPYRLGQYDRPLIREQWMISSKDHLSFYTKLARKKTHPKGWEGSSNENVITIASNQSQPEKNFLCSYGLGHHLKQRKCHLPFMNTDLFVWESFVRLFHKIGKRKTNSQEGYERKRASSVEWKAGTRIRRRDLEQVTWELEPLSTPIASYLSAIATIFLSHQFQLTPIDYRCVPKNNKKLKIFPL